MSMALWDASSVHFCSMEIENFFSPLVFPPFNQDDKRGKKDTTFRGRINFNQGDPKKRNEISGG